MEDEEKEFIEEWLADKTNLASKLKGLGKSFELAGAKFVSICGDGNCFFSACSTSSTACDKLPNGTASKHDELRQRVCDKIVEASKRKDGVLKTKMMSRTTPLEGKALDEYIKKKRQTNGALYTWSDGIIFEAMAEVLDRPIMQLTYPLYRNGEKVEDCGPVFCLS